MKKFTLLLLALVLTMLIAARPAFAAALTSDFEGQKILWIGDSIVVGYGASDDEFKFVNIIDRELGFGETVNYSEGGATISRYVTDNPNFIDNAADMIIADPEAEIIIVFGGINDFYNSVPIGTAADTDATVSFYGGLNTLMDDLTAQYTTARIILVSPMNAAAATPTSYADAMEATANTYDVEFIDMQELTTFDLHDADDQDIYAIDSTHLSDVGNRHLADIFESYLYPDYASGNLFNPLTVNNAQVLTSIGGLEPQPASGFKVSDYMPVEAERYYYYSTYNHVGDAKAVAWYDSDYDFISTTNNLDTIIVSPAEAAYARLQTYMIDVEDTEFYKVVNYDYTVSFNSNGGTIIEDQYVTEYRLVSSPVTPILSSLTFGGWYSDASLSELFSFATAVDEDTTLYAKWTDGTVLPGGTVTPPAETVQLLGLDWYWWVVIVVGAYLILSNKKVQKKLHLKK